MNFASRPIGVVCLLPSEREHGGSQATPRLKTSWGILMLHVAPWAAEGLELENCLHTPSCLGGGDNHVLHPLWGMYITMGNQFRATPGYVFVLLLLHCVPFV